MSPFVAWVVLMFVTVEHTGLIVSESLCYCGLANRGNMNNRIYGGNTTKKNEYPWMVQIRSTIGSFCGGSLINSKWVLTAGHCIYDNMTVTLGDHDMLKDEGMEVKIDVSETILHPEYMYPEGEFVPQYDVALLKLKKDINFTEHAHIRPVCLPENTLEDYTGYDTTVTGWGNGKNGSRPEDKLQYLSGPVETKVQCSKKGCIGGDWCAPPATLHTMICIAYPLAAVMKGDSGSPLVTKPAGNDGVTPGQNYEQIGVTSWNNLALDTVGYAGYTRVTEVLGWIKDTIGKGHSDCPRK